MPNNCSTKGERYAVSGDGLSGSSNKNAHSTLRDLASLTGFTSEFRDKKSMMMTSPVEPKLLRHSEMRCAVCIDLAQVAKPRIKQLTYE